MKKPVPSILLLCIFIAGCQTIKRTREGLRDSLASYYLIQSYSISATRNKTFVKASVYQSQLRENAKPKFVSKVEFNNLEMNRGLIKYESPENPSCGDTENENKSSQIDNPVLVQVPKVNPTPEPTPQESDFYIVLDSFNELNKITITNQQGKTESYLIRLELLRLKNPEAIKISRAKDNIIQLQGKGSGKKEHLNYFVSQENGKFLDEKILQFNPNDNTIKIPATLLKTFRKGLATFHLYSYYYSEIKTPGLSAGNNFTISYTDEICVEIID